MHWDALKHWNDWWTRMMTIVSEFTPVVGAVSSECGMVWVQCPVCHLMHHVWTQTIDAKVHKHVAVTQSVQMLTHSHFDNGLVCHWPKWRLDWVHETAPNKRIVPHSGLNFSSYATGKSWAIDNAQSRPMAWPEWIQALYEVDTAAHKQWWSTQHAHKILSCNKDCQKTFNASWPCRQDHLEGSILRKRRIFLCRMTQGDLNPRNHWQTANDVPAVGWDS